MDTRVKELLKQGDKLFGQREQLMSFWQECAENFYPERAHFTRASSLGEDFASGLMTSYPLIVRRELGNTFSTMLRPSDKDWAAMSIGREADHEGKRWLQWATQTQKRAMYDRAAQFVRATKEGDHDFVTFGQCAITVELMPDRSSLLYRNWHLRDVVWCEGLSGAVETVHRRWKPTAIELARIFGRDKLSSKVREILDKEPYTEIQCRHIVIPSDQYEGKFRTPLVSLYVDVENEHLLEEAGARVNPYVIPRWQTVSGSQYAYSPAVVCALPEARLLQAMTFTLLEAGEKAVSPPMLATQEAIRGDIDIRARGITWVAAEYDERKGAAIQPLNQDKTGIPLGLELQNRSELMLKTAFYLDKLDLPQRGPEMTAYEVGQRVQQYIRNALPLFEPVETDYNGAICERTFEVLLSAGAFGTPDTIPESLLGEDVQFKFTSPLREAVEKQKGQTFLEAGQLVAQAVALDPASGAVIDAAEALRDTLEGIGVPTKWTRSRDAVQAVAEQAAQAQQQQQVLEAMGAAAGVAKDLSGVAV